MKRMKKLLAVMLAAMMVLAMGTSVFADTSSTTTTYTITINNSTSGYAYAAYQIFAGDLSSDGTTLSNVTWGNGINSSSDELKSALNTAYGTVEASEIAAKLTSETEAANFAKIVSGYLQNGKSSEYANNTYTIGVDSAGYYLVANTTVPTDGAYTSYILKVVGSVDVTPKSAVPSLDKTVGDINDSTDSKAATSSSDSADYDIGDEVPFTLTATLPTNYSAYSTYELVFTDTMSKGLTFNSDSVTVTVGETEVDSSRYTVTTSKDNDSGETTVTITITNLKTAAVSATDESKVVVSYTATLNEDASYEESNSATLTYSNNPNGDGTGTTTTDKTTVFTYTLTVNKVDSENNALANAGFTLYKYNGSEYVAVGKEVSGTGDGSNVFTWNGLDDGKYKLVETTTPNGYNTMDDVEFYIVAEHGEDGITSLKVTSDADGKTEITGYTEDTTDGTITADIANYKGASLPSTGGIGTTIFYIVGAILVLGAAVVLVTRRRVSR